MRILPLFWTFFLVFNTLNAEEAKNQPSVGNVEFGVNLYNALEQTANPCISPYSISSALFIPFAGAAGETKDQMAAALKFSQPIPELADSFATINRKLTYHPSSFPDTFRISIANSLWVQNNQRLQPSFLKIVQHELGATVRTTDFAKETEASRTKINGWVDQETFGKIPDLLSEGVLNASTRMVVVSALYLKGLWQSPFNAENTRSEPFFASKSETTTIPMMSQTDGFPYFENEALQAVELPVKSPGNEAPRIAFTVLLPREGSNLEVTAESLNTVFAGLKESQVVVTLPKFQIRDKISVKETLRKLGMEAAFTADANFNGIMEKASLFISDVIHETFLNVAEGGIEAAAATAVVMMRTSLPVEAPKVFRADRPFFFVLRDTKTGVILFLGRYDGS